MISMSPDWPRVLVIGPEPFNNESGFGITISNLFAEWPKDKLACVHFSDIPPDDTICAHHYGLGRHNVEWQLLPRFLTLIFRKAKSGEDADCMGARSSSVVTQSLKKSIGISGLIKRMILRSGAGNLARVRLNAPLKTWVQWFRPEVIYCAVTDLTQIELVLSVAKLTSACVVSHALDDWIMTASQSRNLFQQAIRQYTHYRLIRLYRRSSVCLAIGEAMSRVYQERYGLPFVSFFNCPNASYWARLKIKEWRAQKPFRFVFTGAVYSPGNQTSLIRIAEAVELVTGSNTCTLEIYLAELAQKRLRPFLRGLTSTTLHLPCKDIETVAKLNRDADGLVLTMDFDERLMKSIYLAMPTRLTPFLLSGTPIFAFTPSDTAIGRFLLERKVAYVVDTFLESRILAQRMAEFIENENRRRDIGREAMRVAATEFAGEVVRPRFLEAIRSAVRQDVVRT